MDKKECEKILLEIGLSTNRARSMSSALLVALDRRKLGKKKKGVMEEKDITEPLNNYKAKSRSLATVDRK